MCFDSKPRICTGATVKGTLGSHCKLPPNLCERCAWDSRIAITTFSHRSRKELICTGLSGASLTICFKGYRQGSGSYEFVFADQPGNFRL